MASMHPGGKVQFCELKYSHFAARETQLYIARHWELMWTTP